MKHNSYTQDFYTQKAKQEGWVARSVYKLQEIHKKHLDFAKPLTVLDLGAAPGSWTQYLQKTLTQDSTIVSVDLNPLSINIKPQPLVTSLTVDFTNTQTIENLVSLGPFNYILSDAAPNTTGNKHVDATKSEQLVETIDYIADLCLSTQGIMVAKLFQGSGTSALLQQLRKKYSKVACMRPKAVRSSSVELFLICSRIRFS